MKISYNWLRELTGVEWSPQELRERFTMRGLEVEAVEEAQGDHVFEIAMLSNRPDWLSHLGVAREVGVMTGQGVTLLTAAPQRLEGRAAELTSVDVQATDLCPRFTARVVRGVRIAPSPAWLVERLQAVGLRSINNVADITNYVMLELGQPLHAFDLDKLTEQRIVVRRAREGEQLQTLDGVERKLEAQMLVIADAARAVAVAGVMGGAATEISDATTNVLVECAYFDPVSIRRTSRALGLQTDASDRFERGVDYEGQLRAQARTVALITELAGGAASEDAVDVYPQAITPPTVALRFDRVKALTGLDVPPRESLRILRALGFTPDDAAESLSAMDVASVNFIAPTWRADVSIEEDLVEEVARHFGYEKIVDALPASNNVGEHRAHEGRRRAARRALTASGFDEAISFSFIDAAQDERFELLPNLVAAADASTGSESEPSTDADRIAGKGELEQNGGKNDAQVLSDGASQAGKRAGESVGDENVGSVDDKSVGDQDRSQEDNDARFVSLANPIIEGASRMRATLLSGLLAAVRHNFNHGMRDVRLFEMGRVFAAATMTKSDTRSVESDARPIDGIAPSVEGGARPVEREAFALVATGGAMEADRAAAPRELDFYDLKGALEAACEAMKLPPLEFVAGEARHLREGQSARVALGGRAVGLIGRLADEVAAAYKFRQPVYLAEVDLSALFDIAEQPARYAPLPRFPSVVRDASLIVGRRATFAEMRRAVVGMNLENVSGVKLVYVYEGERVPEGKRSVTLRVEYRANDRTLRDEEADALHRQIVEALEEKFGAQLR